MRLSDLRISRMKRENRLSLPLSLEVLMFDDREVDPREAVVEVPQLFCSGCGWNLDDDDNLCGCDLI